MQRSTDIYSTGYVLYVYTSIAADKHRSLSFQSKSTKHKKWTKSAWLHDRNENAIQMMHAGNLSQVRSNRRPNEKCADFYRFHRRRWKNEETEKLTTKWAKLILFMGEMSNWLKYNVSWRARCPTIPDGRTIHIYVCELHNVDCVRN